MLGAYGQVVSATSIEYEVIFVLWLFLRPWMNFLLNANTGHGAPFGVLTPGLY